MHRLQTLTIFVRNSMSSVTCKCRGTRKSLLIYIVTHSPKQFEYWNITMSLKFCEPGSYQLKEFTGTSWKLLRNSHSRRESRCRHLLADTRWRHNNSSPNGATRTCRRLQTVSELGTYQCIHLQSGHLRQRYDTNRCRRLLYKGNLSTNCKLK